VADRLSLGERGAPLLGVRALRDRERGVGEADDDRDLAGLGGGQPGVEGALDGPVGKGEVADVGGRRGRDRRRQADAAQDEGGKEGDDACSCTVHESPLSGVVTMREH